MLARFVVPFRRRTLTTLFVDFWRVVPLSVDLHRAPTDLATLFIPRAFLMVGRDITPVFMDVDITTAVPTRDVIPLR